LQSITGRQRVAYRHAILLVLSLTFPKKWPPKSPKIAVVDNPTVILRPRPGEPARISTYALYFQKLESLGYIFVADSMGHSIFIRLDVVASQKCDLDVQSSGRRHERLLRLTYLPDKPREYRYILYISLETRIILPLIVGLWAYYSVVFLVGSVKRFFLQ